MSVSQPTPTPAQVAAFQALGPGRFGSRTAATLEGEELIAGLLYAILQGQQGQAGGTAAAGGSTGGGSRTSTAPAGVRPGGGALLPPTPTVRPIISGPWYVVLPVSPPAGATGFDSFQVVDSNGMVPNPLATAAESYSQAKIEWLPPSRAAGISTTINEIVNASGACTIYTNDNVPASVASGDPLLILPNPDQAQDIRTPFVINDLGAGGTIAEFEALFSGTWQVLLNPATATQVNLTVTPASGSAFVPYPVEGGQQFSAGQWSSFSIPVSRGASYQLTAVTAQDGNLMVAILGAPTIGGAGGGGGGVGPGTTNITEVGGEAVPSPGGAYSGPMVPVAGNDGEYARIIYTDPNGRPNVQVEQAQGSSGSPQPVQSLQVGGSDGTDLRTLATDSAGRLTPQPQGLVWDAAGLAVTANTNVFGSSYQPPTAGVLTLTIGNCETSQGGAAAIAILVKTANSAPSGGSAGTRPFQLNSGNALAVEEILTFQIGVTPNDDYNLQFGTNTTVDVTATFKAY